MSCSRSTSSISSDSTASLFDKIATDYAQFAADLGFASLVMIPLSARHGDNLTERSPRTPWYRGPSLLEHLETIDVTEDAAGQKFRFPVQWVNRPNHEFRGFSGTVASGEVAPGDPIQVMGSSRASRVKEIVTFDGPLARASSGDAVTLTLEDEIDIARGDMLVPPRCAVRIRRPVRRASRLDEGRPARSGPLLLAEMRHKDRVGLGDRP